MTSLSSALEPCERTAEAPAPVSTAMIEKMRSGTAAKASTLQHEDRDPQEFAYDRPSPKLIGFLRKHYGLNDFTPQQNKFVLFEQFFRSRQPKAATMYDSVRDRPLTARNNRRR